MKENKFNEHYLTVMGFPSSVLSISVIIGFWELITASVNIKPQFCTPESDHTPCQFCKTLVENY